MASRALSSYEILPPGVPSIRPTLAVADPLTAAITVASSVDVEAGVTLLVAPSAAMAVAVLNADWTFHQPAGSPPFSFKTMRDVFDVHGGGVIARQWAN